MSFFDAVVEQVARWVVPAQLRLGLIERCRECRTSYPWHDWHWWMCTWIKSDRDYLNNVFPIVPINRVDRFYNFNKEDPWVF
jgi:hypothetical protein